MWLQGGHSYRETVLVDGDFLDEIPALDADFLLRQQLVDDHVRQMLPLIETGRRNMDQ